MSFQALRDGLIAASNQIQAHPQLKKLNPESGYYNFIRNKIVDDSNGLPQKVSELMQSVQELEAYGNGYFQPTPQTGSLSSVTWLTLANWLLAQTALSSPDEALELLTSFVSSDSTRMKEVIAIWGLNPKTRLKLTNDIQLVPISELESTEARDSVTGIEPQLNALTHSFFRPHCTAALVREVNHKNILVKSESQLPKSYRKTLESLPGDFKSQVAKLKTNDGDVIEIDPEPSDDPKSETLKEIVKCLCLLKNRAVCEVASWYECALSVPIIGGVKLWSTHTFDPIFNHRIGPEDYDQNDVEAVVERFLKLSPTDRCRLYIPLSRLNTALREQNVSDRALDLGIAVESLINPGDQEISYKTRVRGTLLLGGSPDEKRRAFNCLKELYNLRSKVAHGNDVSLEVKLETKKIPTAIFLDECCRLTARMIRTILKNGFVSDWEGQLLGFDSAVKSST